MEMFITFDICSIKFYILLKLQLCVLYHTFVSKPKLTLQFVIHSAH